MLVYKRRWEEGGKERGRETEILKINKIFTNTIMKSFIIILGLFY